MKATSFLLSAAAALGALTLGAADWSVRPFNGVPRLVKDGVPQSNYVFTAARVGTKLEIESVTPEIRMAKKTGVKVYSISFKPFFKGPDDPEAIAFAENVCKHVFANDPDAYLFPRVNVDASLLIKNEMRERNRSYDGGSEMGSVSSVKVQEEAKRALRGFIRYMEKHHGDRMMGYHVAYGNHGEFLYYSFDRRCNFLGYDPATITAFRAFLKKKYGTPQKLAAAWRKEGVNFNNAMVPPPTRRFGRPGEAFHDPARDWQVIDFNEFFNESMADFALMLAKVVREECGKKRVTGIFYGYIFECMRHVNAPAFAGHYALRKVLDSPDVDMVCGPFSYYNQARVLGGPQFTHTAGESVTASGKLWVNEDDTATHISFARREWEDGSHRQTMDRDLEETKLLIRRNFLFGLARNYGVWWYDHYAHGMWNDPELWKEKARADRLEAVLVKEPSSYKHDIILTIDEKASRYIVSSEVPHYAMEGICVMRDRVSRSGCTSGMWMLDDILKGKAPDSKLDIHTCAVALTKAERDILKARAARIPTVWMWAPGYVDLDKQELSLDAVKELTGFAVRKVNPATWYFAATPDGMHVNMPDVFGWGKTANPVFAPIPDKSKGDVVLAWWRDLWNVPAIVFRPAQDGKPFSIFCAAVELPSSVIRAYARKAGAHVYTSRDAGIHQGRDFVAVTASEEGTYDLNVGGSEAWFNAYTGQPLGVGPKLILELGKGETVAVCRKAFLDQLPPLKY